MHKPEVITGLINNVEGVSVVTPFELHDDAIKGQIAIAVDQVTLEFSVAVYPPYPFQFHEHDVIRFVNPDLLEYNHVNRDGSICLHTLHSPDLPTKIHFDLDALRQWIVKYYINRDQDTHYEHIVVPESTIDGVKPTFLFTEVDHTFAAGEFGYVTYSLFSKGLSGNMPVYTHLVLGFQSGKKSIPCKWSSHYQKPPKPERGLFIFLKDPPVEHKRFAFLNWKQLEPLVSQAFLQFMYEEDKLLKSSKNPLATIPLFIGYTINESEIYWQAVIIRTNQFPNYGEKVVGRVDRLSRLQDAPMEWVKTYDSSYKYFFGRGALHSGIAKSKILIIGIGAVGSMVATTLTRGGCTRLTLLDHDIKEPENVCRSEYPFHSGITNKVDDLAQQLINISPFLHVEFNEHLMDIVKMVSSTSDVFEPFEKYLADYDLIVDCSTDNDVAYILDRLPIRAEVINLSITNHAKELICAVKPNLYRWMTELFDRLEQDTTDLYNPTGCWSPTFKASYNDVATLVQPALKHINSCYENALPVRNFYLSACADNGLTIQLKQF